MIKLFSKHKKLCIILASIITAFLCFIYLRALFTPGLWHGDAFLYRQNDGSFRGSDFYAEYEMTINEAEYGTDIDFSVNGKIKNYQIKYDKEDSSRNVEVLENGSVICKGTAIGNENNWFLFDEREGSSDAVVVRIGNDIPTEEELYPNYTSLYNWAVAEKTDTRGEPYMLLIILLIGIILFLDIKYPNLFWVLEHRLDVDGGEPSDWYLFGQKVGRVVMSIGILVCVIMTFTTH